MVRRSFTGDVTCEPAERHRDVPAAVGSWGGLRFGADAASRDGGV